MKLYTEVYIIILAIIFFTDYFLYKQSKKRILIEKIFHFAPGVLFAGAYTFLKLFSDQFNSYLFLLFEMWFNLFFLSIYVSKVLFLTVEFAGRKLKWKNKSTAKTKVFVIGGFLILLFYCSIIIPEKTDVNKTTITFKNLPTSYNNYTIVQVSDIHLGSRINGIDFLKKVVREINDLQPDLVVFTGDMVNNFAEETKGFDSIFLQIKAKDGKFAVLGNHDYGDYSEWKSENEKKRNFDDIKVAIQQFGFKLLTNEHVILHKGKDSIALIGVENFHDKEYKSYSDLGKSVKGIDNRTFKILLSHNPNHWKKEVLTGSTPIALTLSGHTHAAQMGFKAGKTVLSPAWFLYKQYNGLYYEKDAYLYVSRGIGYIGLPLLVGLSPEISVIQLKMK